VEQLIISFFIAFFAVEFLVEFLLNELNMGYVRGRWAEKNLPELFSGKMSSEDYHKSVDYTLAKGRFQRWDQLYEGFVTLLVLFGGVLPYLDRLSQDLDSRFPAGTQATGILFCLSTGLVLSVLGLPTDLYGTFVIEERFGFNKMTLRLYFTDKLKGLCLGVGIGVPFLFGVLWLMEATGPYWWVWAFFFVFGFQLLMIFIYPTLIAPLFNKFEPLPEGELRARILALTGRIGFQASGIHTVDGSRRSAHSNAYFTGIGKSKRIVLFDTLLEQLTVDQALAVLAHEMGHYKMKHILRMMLIQAGLLLVGLYILGLLVDYEPMFRAFGLERASSHGALILFALVSGPFTFYLDPFVNFLSRRYEYKADRFAVHTLKDGKSMEEALVNLTVKNLSNLTPHPWYSAYHYSHPTPAERIAAIQQGL